MSQPTKNDLNPSQSSPSQPPPNDPLTADSPAQHNPARSTHPEPLRDDSTPLSCRTMRDFFRVRRAHVTSILDSTKHRLAAWKERKAIYRGELLQMDVTSFDKSRKDSLVNGIGMYDDIMEQLHAMKEECVKELTSVDFMENMVSESSLDEELSEEMRVRMEGHIAQISDVEV